VGINSRLAGGTLAALCMVACPDGCLESFKLPFEIKTGILIVCKEGLEGNPLLFPPGEDRCRVGLVLFNEPANAVVEGIDRYLRQSYAVSHIDEDSPPWPDLLDQPFLLGFFGRLGRRQLKLSGAIDLVLGIDIGEILRPAAPQTVSLGTFDELATRAIIR